MRSLIVLGLFAICIDAAAQDRSGGYIGGGLGSFSYQEDLSYIAPGTEFDESSTALKLFGGYRFGDYLGVEADWRDIDDLEVSESFFIPDIGTLSTTLGAKIDAITIRVLGYLPLSWGSLFVGGGYFDYDADVYIRAELEGLGPADPLTDSASDSGGTALLGLQWEMESVDIRLEYEWFDFEDADVQQIGIGVAYRF